MITLDEQQLYNKMIASMELELGEVLNPGDERRIVAGNILSVIVSIVNQGNAFARAQFLEDSYGEQLVNLGRFVGGVKPLPAACASVTVQFSISAPSGYSGQIPTGTLLTADGQKFFTLRETLFFSWDSTPPVTTAYATEGGAGYNGYPAGTINTIVKPIQYVKVTNIGVSVGGTDREDDDSYRERIFMASSSRSSAGPAMAYQFYALSADAAIGDVGIANPAPRKVEVTILLKGGGIPTQSILDKVLTALSAKDVRPLTDLVVVKAAIAHEYTAIADYYISTERASEELQIRAAVTQEYNNYLLWQREKLGRAINPDQLRWMVLDAGACRIDIPSLEYTAIAGDKVAIAAPASALSYKGLLP